MGSLLLSENSAAVELAHVSKTFGQARALHAVTLRIQAGERAVLLGPNGAGKTTAISLMIGLRLPTLGTVRVGGKDPRDPVVRASIGALLQGAALPEALRVIEAVELFRSFHATSFTTRTLLKAAGLEPKARSRIGCLSTGERQRLLFSVALAGNPSILFLDEPTASMDVDGRVRIKLVVRELVRDGRTIILATRSPQEAETFADKIIVMSRGAVMAVGTPGQIKQLGGAERLEEAVLALTSQPSGAHP